MDMMRFLSYYVFENLFRILSIPWGTCWRVDYPGGWCSTVRRRSR